MRLILVLLLLVSCLSFSPECQVKKDDTQRNVQIIVFLDSTHLEIFTNWLLYFHRDCSNIKQLLLPVCLDQTSINYLSLFGIQCSKSFVKPSSKKNSLYEIWMKRIQLIQSKLDSGTDIILSDSDAIWLRSPFQILSSLSNSDVISSRAWWPWVESQTWGATLCMGFIYFQSTPRTRILLQGVLEHMKETAKERKESVDDQISLNTVLHRWNITWDSKMSVEDNLKTNTGWVDLRHISSYLSPSPLSFSFSNPLTLTLPSHSGMFKNLSPSESYLNPLQNIDMRDKKLELNQNHLLEVSLLPHHLFVRKCSINVKALIARSRRGYASTRPFTPQSTTSSTTSTSSNLQDTPPLPLPPPPSLSSSQSSSSISSSSEFDSSLNPPSSSPPSISSSTPTDSSSHSTSLSSDPHLFLSHQTSHQSSRSQNTLTPRSQSQSRPSSEYRNRNRNGIQSSSRNQRRSRSRSRSKTDQFERKLKETSINNNNNNNNHNNNNYDDDDGSRIEENERKEKEKGWEVEGEDRKDEEEIIRNSLMNMNRSKDQQERRLLNNIDERNAKITEEEIGLKKQLSESFIMHCLIHKGGTSQRKKLLSGAGLWALKNDYVKILVTSLQKVRDDPESILRSRFIAQQLNGNYSISSFSSSSSRSSTSSSSFISSSFSPISSLSRYSQLYLDSPLNIALPSFSLPSYLSDLYSTHTPSPEVHDTTSSRTSITTTITSQFQSHSLEKNSISQRDMERERELSSDLFLHYLLSSISLLS